MAANLFGLQLDFNLSDEDEYVGVVEAVAIELGRNWINGNDLDNEWISDDIKRIAKSYIEMGLHTEYKTLHEVLQNNL